MRTRSRAQGDLGLRRRIQLAATFAALRPRTGGSAATARHRDRARRARRRRRPAGSSADPREYRCAATDHDERCHQSSGSPGHGRACIIGVAQGAADDRRRLCSGAFFKTSPRLATPDMQIHFMLFRPTRSAKSCIRFPASPLRSASCGPESRGSLRIKSADPQCRRQSSLNYLAAETDRHAFIDGIRILRKILAAPALKPYIVEEVDPGAKIVSDEDLSTFCRRTGTPSIIRPRPAGWATIRSPWSTSA